MILKPAILSMYKASVPVTHPNYVLLAYVISDSDLSYNSDSQKQTKSLILEYSFQLKGTIISDLKRRTCLKKSH